MNDPIRPPSPDELDPIETASRDEIAALQLTRLRATLERAYDNVAHYKRRFDEAGVSPADLRSLDDVAKFPFTVKEDLRLNYPFELFAVPRERIVRIHASSGTTGLPTVVGYTQADLDTWAALVARCLRAAGTRSGDMVHVAYGYGLFTGGLGFHSGAEKLGCTVVPASGGFTERQVRMICDFEPRIIAVTPSYLLAIADEFERQRRDPRCSSLEIGMHGAEPWTEAMRGEIEARFAMQAMDVYGCSEAIGPGVSVECIESKDGLHIWEDHFYPEIVDPETGAVLPDGEPGELVITSLTKEACPIVRYRTRDLTRLLPGTARSMRRMQRVKGRNDDMLIIRGVNLFPSFIEELSAGGPAPLAPLLSRSEPPQPPRRVDGRGRGEDRRRRRSDAGGGRARPRRAHKVAGRRRQRGQGRRAGLDRALRRQGQAGFRPAPQGLGRDPI